MPYTAEWEPIFSAPYTEKIIAATISPYRIDPTTNSPPLALQPGSICVATHRNVVLTDQRSGRKVPFDPWIGSWPTVTRRFSPQERRAEIAATSVELLADSGAAAKFLDIAAGGGGCTARIDMVSPGVPLERSIQLAAGFVKTPGPERRGSGVKLSVIDGDPERSVQFPPGALTREDFPLAPDSTVDVCFRRVIVGNAPARLLCWQIDQERRVFYYADETIETLPQRVEKGGRAVTGWRAERATSPTGLRYVQIVFEQPVDQIVAGLTEDISASGAIGVVDENAVALLCRAGQLTLSPAALAALPGFTRDFPLSLTFDGESTAIDLLRNRVIPQSPFASTFRRGRFELIRLDQQTPQIRMGLGSGLLFRTPDQPDRLDEQSIWNAIEVKCGRDQFASSAQSGAAPLYRTLRDRNHGTPLQRSRAAKSERLFGRRYLSVPANDLAVTLDRNFNVVGCPGGERLADLLIGLHVLPRRSHRYQADWAWGMALDWNWRVLLTDESEGLDDMPTRVVEISYTANGPVVTLQEDWI